MRWIFFNSTEGLWQEDWIRRRTRRILLARRQDMANISRISVAGMDGTVKTSMRSGNTATPRQIFSNQGLQGLWMFGDTGQAMGVHLRSTSHGGHGYLRGGGSVTSVPLTHHSALWLAGLGGGISYYIMPPSYIHSSIALLFLIYLIYTNIAPILVLIKKAYQFLI